MNYSIRYMNEKGVTERSEFLTLESDDAATDHAHADLRRHFIVEVWKGDELLSRTFRDAVGN
jgi:hypothetical protein